MPGEPARTDIGSKSFDPAAGTVTDPDGRSVQLRPQSVEVLSILAETRGALVSKADLMDRVWPDTQVTDDSLVQCVSEIRKALGAEDGALLRTVPKKGYRLDGAGAADPARPRRSLLLGGGAALAAVVLAGGVYTVLRPGAPRGPSGDAARAAAPSIAVLPFLNLSGDAGQDYFSDGITDDLITGLSKVSGLVVIARATSFAYRGGGVPADEVAGKLGVGYVLVGSVRRDGDRVRINAQLTDGNTGTNVWAERYEGSLGDVFTLQDRVTNSIVASLQVRLTPDEARRLARPLTRDPAAYDLYLRGIRAQGAFDKASNETAQDLFRQAIGIDPDFASAWANLAQALSLAIENAWADDPVATKALALEAARKATRLDPELPYAWWSLGRILTRSYAFDAPAAREAFRTAIELNPNFADGYIFLALTSIFTGHVEDAMAPIDKAMRLNPDYPFWYLQTLGMAQYYLGNYQAAATMYERAIERNSAVPWLYPLLIASYGKLGRTDDADWMAGEYEALGQIATIRAMSANSLVQDASYRQDFEDGLRKAGISEG